MNGSIHCWLVVVKRPSIGPYEEEGVSVCDGGGEGGASEMCVDVCVCVCVCV
ncbi:hypothetical protein THAOC_00634, partial [Thalassiosira oceanica]